MYQDIKDEMKRRFQNSRLMDKFRNNQANSLQPLQSFGQAQPNVMGSAVSNAINSEVIGNTSQGLTQTAGNTISKATPIVGGVMNGIGAANDFANGDYINGGLNAAKTVATFIPGGQVVAGAIQAGQILKDLFAPDRSQEMMQKSIEEAIKSQQLSNEALANQRQGFDEQRQKNLQTMQQNQYDFNDATYQAPEATDFSNALTYNDTPEALTGSVKGYTGELPDLNQTQGTPEANKQSILQKLGSFAGDFAQGYEDNVTNGFKQGDLYNMIQAKQQAPTTPATEEGVATGDAAPVQQPKSIGNRIGEAVGTGQRVISNPWTQAAIAGMITKATGGDWADAANNAYKYGTAKATSDRYKQLVDPNGKPSVIGNYTVDDYNAMIDAKRKQYQNEYDMIRGINDTNRTNAQIDKWNKDVELTKDKNQHQYDYWNNMIKANDKRADAAMINANSQAAYRNSSAKNQQDRLDWDKQKYAQMVKNQQDLIKAKKINEDIQNALINPKTKNVANTLYQSGATDEEVHEYLKMRGLLY